MNNRWKWTVNSAFWVTDLIEYNKWTVDNVILRNLFFRLKEWRGLNSLKSVFKQNTNWYDT